MLPPAEQHPPDLVAGTRVTVRQLAAEFGHAEHADDAALVASELVTNAVLHGGGCAGVDVTSTGRGLRIAVRDRNRVPPVLGQLSDASLTGRGLRLVTAVSHTWGADIEDEGKVVWAEITGEDDVAGGLGADDLVTMWDDHWDAVGPDSIRVELGDVPTDLLLAAKAHVDSVVRELTLAAAGAEAGLTAALPPHLVGLSSVVERFGEARVSIKHPSAHALASGWQRVGG